MKNKNILFIIFIIFILYTGLNVKNSNLESYKYLNNQLNLQSTNYKFGTIDVYFKGARYLSKVIVNNSISSKETFTFSGPINTSIKITNLIPEFNEPVSVVSWGRDFTKSSNPTQSRFGGLFNQTACRVDYNSEDNSLIFTNATTTNLGVPSTSKLPASTETLVARIYLIYF